jgi:hypothetical protein
MKSSQSFKHNARGLVTCLSTRFIGRDTLLPMTHGCLITTCTHSISLKNSTPKEERSKQLKGDKSDCEDSSALSYVFPSQHRKQPFPLLLTTMKDPRWPCHQTMTPYDRYSRQQSIPPTSSRPSQCSTPTMKAMTAMKNVREEDKSYMLQSKFSAMTMKRKMPP